MDVPSLTTSIAMATFQGAKHLREQLESIARQSRRPTELVVSDDASQDGTPDILDAFARTAPFDVRVVRGHTRVGYVRNFERALQMCTGDIVFFCDQDDVWFESKVAVVCDVMQREPSRHVVIHDRVVVDGSLRSTGTSSLSALRARGGKLTSYVAGSSTALRRPLVDLVLPFPEPARVGHDAWVHQVAHGLGVVGVLEQPLMYYRRHGANASRSLVEPGRRSSRARLLLVGLSRQLSDSLSGRRAELLLNQRDVQASLAFRLRSPAAQALSADALSSASAADLRASHISLRLDAYRYGRLTRTKALGRAWRSAAYSDVTSGTGAFVLDLLTPRSRRDPNEE